MRIVTGLGVLTLVVLTHTGHANAAVAGIISATGCISESGPISMAATCVNNTYKSYCSTGKPSDDCPMIAQLNGTIAGALEDVNRGRLSEREGQRVVFTAKESALLVVKGPSTAQPTISAHASSPPPPTVDPLVQCTRDLARDSLFAELARKLPLEDMTQISFTMLTDATRATPLERRELAEWFHRHDECWTTSESLHREQWPLEVFQLSKESNSGIQAIGIQLYDRKITYGEANKQLQALGNDISAKLIPIVRQYQAQIAAQQQAAEERTARAEAAAQQRRDYAERQAYEAQRQAEAQAAQNELVRLERQQMFLNYLQATRPVQVQVQAPVQMQHTTQTNCNSFGNSINCTTY
jgi:hypothetical protein